MANCGKALDEIEGLYGDVEGVKSLVKEIKNMPRPDVPTR